MSIRTVDELVEVLRFERILPPDQLEELTPELLASFDNPRSFAKLLVEHARLTVFQAHAIFEGRGRELVLGNYRILDLLGEGGVSEVFKARDTRGNRLVALKVLRQHLLSESGVIRQFQREMEAVARLNHPNIIKTLDTGQVGGTHYFAMEFVEGTDLGKVVQFSGPLSLGEACDCIRQVTQGLQHAHQLGLVHRDIKPANLFLILPPGHPQATAGSTWKRPQDPVIKILDWGLARLAGSTPDTDATACSEEGMLIGTADYIAPEQARDARVVDIRADIYSLGCTFYYLLTGQPPFPGTSLMQKLLQHQQSEPTPLQTLRPDVPDELAAIIQKMMAKAPEARYQIPLAVGVPLRKFCEVNAVANGCGTPLRPEGGSGPVRRPTGSGLVARPPGSGLVKRTTGSSPQGK
jgi:serine/threonine protein kinase